MLYYKLEIQLNNIIMFTKNLYIEDMVLQNQD